MAPGAQLLALVFTQAGVGAVFQQVDAVPVADITQLVHLGRETPQVRHPDRLGAGGDQGFDLVRVHQEVIRADVRPNRGQAVVHAGNAVELHHRVADDLVPVPGADRARDGLHQEHGGSGGDGVFGAVRRGKILP